MNHTHSHIKICQKNKIRLHTAHDGMTACGTLIGSLAVEKRERRREANGMGNPHRGI